MFWRNVSLPATCSHWFLARGFFYPEDGGNTFLWNVSSHKIYVALHPRRRHSSMNILFHTWTCIVMSSHSVMLMSSSNGLPCYQRQYSDNNFMVVWGNISNPFQDHSIVFFSQEKNNIVALKRVTVHSLSYLPTLDPVSCGSEWPSPLLPASVTQPVPHPTHLNTEAAGSVFPQKLIHLQECIVSQSKRPQSMQVRK
jgi:hypothetical protein